MSQQCAGMFERFTARARKVMALANQEAQRFNHEFVGTEHILLGLVKEGDGIGAQVLKTLDLDLPTIRLEVEKLIKHGPDVVAMGRLPLTPRAKKVLEHALDEMHALDHNYVGTEHLLLGLLRERHGVAARVLTNLQVKLNYVREEVLNILAGRRDKTDLPQGRSAEVRLRPSYVPIFTRSSAMIPDKIAEAFNSQLNGELYSAYLYLSMSASLASQNLPGYSAWMRVQTKEEFQHAMKFYDYIIARAGKVTLTAIDSPPTDWDSPLAIARHTCKHEKKVTGLINDLARLAESESDSESRKFLQWFIDEQVEEEENVGKVLALVTKASDSHTQLQTLDRELAKRGQS